MVMVVDLATEEVETSTRFVDSPAANVTSSGAVATLPDTEMLAVTDRPTWLELRPIWSIALAPPFNWEGETDADCTWIGYNLTVLVCTLPLNFAEMTNDSVTERESAA